MNKSFSRLIYSIVFLVIFSLGSMSAPEASAQFYQQEREAPTPPPQRDGGSGGSGPPLPPGSHGQGGDQPAAPIGAGIAILIGLAAVYGGKRVYDARRRFKK